jgi:hypothetical protein
MGSVAKDLTSNGAFNRVGRLSDYALQGLPRVLLFHPLPALCVASDRVAGWQSPGFCPTAQSVTARIVRDGIRPPPREAEGKPACPNLWPAVRPCQA